VKSILTVLSCSPGEQTLIPFLNPHNQPLSPQSYLLYLAHGKIYPSIFTSQTLLVICIVSFSSFILASVFFSCAPTHVPRSMLLLSPPPSPKRDTLLPPIRPLFSLLICATSIYPSILWFLVNLRSLFFSVSISVVAVLNSSRFVFAM